MATSKASVHLRGRFSPGTKVGLYERYGDVFRGGRALKSATVDKNGEVEFKGLEEAARFWIAGEVDGDERAVAMTAKGDDATKRLTGAQVRDRLAQTRPNPQRREIVTGARTTSNTRVTGARGEPFADERVGKPTPKDEREDEPQPYPRIEDMPKGTPLRSHTITGSAHPVEPGEKQPTIPQSDVRKGTPQRSDTEFGEAALKTATDEEQPKRRQESQSGKQRSDTPTGEAEPKPRAKPKRQAQVRDSAKSKARGATDAVAGTTKKATKKETKDAG